jgi:hypothetical protein
MPAGFVLHDVLVSGARYPLVLRAQPIQDSGKPATAGETSNPPQRLLEMSARNGSLLREFVFDKPRIDAVTCAAATSLTAIFPDTIADTAPPAAGIGEPTAATKKVTQVVIATAPR